MTTGGVGYVEEVECFLSGNPTQTLGGDARKPTMPSLSQAGLIH